MPTGKGILERARAHVGEIYRNVLVPKNDPDWSGPWDCAEFASWLVFQESGQLYGCTNPDGDPAKTEAYTGAWRRDAEKRGRMVSVEEAAATPGAMLLRYPPGPGQMGHIAVSDGKGGTVEAKSSKDGVVADKVGGRRWNTGVLVPGIDYHGATERVSVRPPAVLYALGLPNMNPEVVRRIQRALKDKHFDPGTIDGVFTPDMAEAVNRFQKAMGIVADGEVGPETARLLGLDLPGAVGAVARAAITGVVATNPLLAVATAVLPGIVRAIAGDTRGAVAASAAQAVADITGATDPDTARVRIEEDPAMEAALQIRLAEIASDRERDRLDAEAATRRDGAATEAKRREDELDELRQRLGDAENARAAAAELARIGGPASWAPTIVSVIVTGGFFLMLAGFLGMLAWKPYVSDKQYDPVVLQIVNVGIGALTVAFSTVVAFWLGSSDGSRRKDVITAENREQQAKRDERAVTDSTTLAKKLIEKSAAPAAAAIAETTGKPAFSNFERCLEVVFAREGGFSNDPRDRGGATNFGITRATLTASRGHEVSEDDVRNLTREEAREIYRSSYWNRLRCDDLPLGVDLMVFDFGVHAGPAASARVLQKAVGAEVDGSIGDATVGATNAARPRTTLDEFHRLKLERYQKMDGWKTYANGWSNRADAIRTAALDMLAPAMLGPRPLAA